MDEDGGDKIRVRAQRDGSVEVGLHSLGSYIGVSLSPTEITELVHGLLRSSVQAHLLSGDKNDPRHIAPLQGADDMHAPISWPLMVAFGSADSPKNHQLVGLVGAFGKAQLMMGLQRNQLKQLAQMLVQLDKTLPPSNHFELGLDDIDANEG